MNCQEHGKQLQQAGISASVMIKPECKGFMFQRLVVSWNITYGNVCLPNMSWFSGCRHPTVDLNKYLYLPCTSPVILLLGKLLKQLCLLILFIQLFPNCKLLLMYFKNNLLSHWMLKASKLLCLEKVGNCFISSALGFTDVSVFIVLHLQTLAFNIWIILAQGPKKKAHMLLANVSASLVLGNSLVLQEKKKLGIRWYQLGTY